MFTLSADFITRNIRVALFALSGALISRGIMTEDIANGVAGVVLQAVTWAWSLWGNRVVAKINELVKMDNFIVIAPAEIAKEVPSPSAMPMEAVTVVAPAPLANQVNAENGNANIRSERDVKLVEK